jgi:DNA-binding MurR/RpiR family transcriptional regulator
MTILSRLREADRYNRKHYERDPLHSEAADAIEELADHLKRVIDNVRTGSLESECQAIDAAERVLLARGLG